MRRLAGAMAAVLVAVSSAPARAEEAAPRGERGPASTAGLVLLGLGLGATGVGLAGLLGMLDANRLLQGYVTAGGAVAAADAQVAADLGARAAEQRTLAIAGLSAAGALLVSGVLCLVLDAPRNVAVGLAPAPGGAWLTARLIW